MKEVTVAKVNEFRDREMRQIAVEDSQILLAKIDDRFYATGSFCPHYGAPLVTGILCSKKVICPWHNASFSIQDGSLLEPPALDGLPSFPVRIEGDNVLVELPEEILDRHTPQMAKQDLQKDDRVFVILGSGAAGSIAAETLRQEGFQGKIILISKEDKLPYDRTKLSKNYLQGNASADSLPLRSCEFYQENDIELYFDRTVTQVDPSNKTILFADNTTLNYDSLLLATGGKPRKLDLPGSNLANIFTLRQTKDVERIIEAANNAKQAVIIGSSFIGMEAAASLTQRGIKVTVVSPNSVPFEKILGLEIGRMFQQLHQERGVTFHFNTKATQFTGNNRVETVILENGTTIPTDLVIVGIGVQPNTDYLQGVELSEDGSIPVSEYLQVAAPDLYAAGDIARFPYALLGKPTRIEHWRLAAQQGRIAAQNMIKERPIKFTNIPFFWSGQYDLKLRYVGHADIWDEVVIDGDLATQKFLAYYVKDNRILAVAGCGRDKDIATISELMHLKQMPDADKVRNHQIDWTNNAPQN